MICLLIVALFMGLMLTELIDIPGLKRKMEINALARASSKREQERTERRPGNRYTRAGMGG